MNSEASYYAKKLRKYKSRYRDMGGLVSQTGGKTSGCVPLAVNDCAMNKNEHCQHIYAKSSKASQHADGKCVCNHTRICVKQSSRTGRSVMVERLKKRNEQLRRQLEKC